MKVYQHKKRWKWLLFCSAMVIFLSFIFYSNLLINNIADEERRKISVWADAISYRAELVLHTEGFFNNVKNSERGRAKLLAQAIQKVQESDLNEDITFYHNVITSHSSIPSIITDEKGNINTTVNVDTTIQKMKNVSEMGERVFDFNRLLVPYHKDKYNVVYYSESVIFSDLKKVLDGLIESFFREVVINMTSVPVVITNEAKNRVITSGRIETEKVRNNLPEILEGMASENPPITIELPSIGICHVFYEDSSVLKQLRFFPYIQLGIIFVFTLVAYLLFSFARKSEQNQVWVGMSKETAHQLGTPISSLLAWNELLKSQDCDPMITKEIQKDLERLETIAQRFSKIGSLPEIKEENLLEVLENFLSYLKSRVSAKVEIKFNSNNLNPILPINKYLFEWVIENICKNSIDAIDGYGVIIIDLSADERHIFIDISDTGKGIPAKRHKEIFEPGYTSKKRGWGLGLTLAKRIIEEYHGGKLFVLSSSPKKGTVMRIELHKEMASPKA